MWEFISSTNVTSGVSEVDFTTLSTDFIDFCVVITDFHPSDDASELAARVFTGTGGSQAIVDGNSYHYSAIVKDNSDDGAHDTGTNTMRISRPVGSSATEGAAFEVVFFNPHSTTLHKMMKAHGVVQGTDTGRIGVNNAAGKYTSTTAVTGFRIFPSAGTIDLGRFSLYGRKHS